MPMPFPLPEEENATMVPPPGAVSPQAAASPHPVAPPMPPPQGAPSAAMSVGAPTQRGGPDWGRILGAVGPALLAGVGVAKGGDVGHALGGLAAGFADRRSQHGKEMRERTHKQNEMMLETAHKAVMALQGKDLKDFPNLAKLRDKYNQAMASQESDGSFISPKEAVELVGLWTISQGEYGQAQDQAAGRAARVEGQAGAQRAIGEEMGYDPKLTPEAAQAAVLGRRQAAQAAAAPVDLGGLGIEGMPKGLTVSSEAAAKLLMEKVTQDGIAQRMGKQQAAQFSREMARMQEQFKQAQMQQNAAGMRQIFETALTRATTPNPLTGRMPFPTHEAAAEWVRGVLTNMGPMLTPPPDAMKGKGKVLGEIP